MKIRGDAKKIVFAVSGALCLAVALAFAFMYRGTLTEGRARVIEPRPAYEDAAAAAPTEIIAVYVTGAVRRPGVYRLREGARVEDALAAAGGFAPYADISHVNLAARVVDGDHIYFAPRGRSKGNDAPTDEAPRQTELRAAPSRPTGKVDINTAGVDELNTLPGIGPVLAGAIVSWREKNGSFKTIDEITKVSGIGAKRYEAIKDLITTGSR